MNQELYSAAKTGDARGISAALRAGVRDINATNTRGLACLHIVCELGSLECAELLIRARASAEAASAPSFETPLHIAALNGHAHLVPLLAKSGRINAQDVRRSTAIATAAVAGHCEVIVALLRAGADANITDYKFRTALDLAIQYQQPKAARLLEANGATRSPNAEPSAAVGVAPPVPGGGPAVATQRAPPPSSSSQQQQQQKQRGLPAASSSRPQIYGTGGANYTDDDQGVYRGPRGQAPLGDGGQTGVADATPEEEVPKQSPTEILEEELAKIVGLEEVKEMLRTLCKQVEVDQRRARFGFKPQHNVNMLFVGNPGTGKTSMARVVARMLKELGVLKEGQVVEVSRKDMVAEYAGQSAVKTSGKITEAVGGVLFVDEAYSLKHESGQDGFGQECVSQLVQEMENKREELVVIMAGYTKEMNAFIATNSGLASRFPVTIEFPNYTYEDMAKIFEVMVSDRKLRLDAALHRERLITLITRNIPKSLAIKGNGRAVRNLLDAVLRQQTKRLAESGTEVEEELLTIIEEDFGSLQPEKTVSELDEVLAELDSVVGIADVKAFLRRLRAQIQITQEKKALGIPVENGYGSLNMVFKGNPGTGKTMMARLVGKLLKALGVLSTGQLIEATRQDLIGDHLGETAGKTQKLLDRALGGVLFIDEAYSLINGGKDSYGKEAVETMIKMMEDWRSELVIILAGYSGEMEKLLDKNPGIRSRFNVVIEFADYTGQDLVDISAKMLSGMNMQLSHDAHVTLARMCAANAAMGGDNNGNARWMRNLIEKACAHQAQRLCSDDHRTKEDLITLHAADFDPTQAPPMKTYAQIAASGGLGGGVGRKMDQMNLYQQSPLSDSSSGSTVYNLPSSSHHHHQQQYDQQQYHHHQQRWGGAGGAGAGGMDMGGGMYQPLPPQQQQQQYQKGRSAYPEDDSQMLCL